MSEKRDIPKNTKAPTLNEEVINLLTKLCFRENDEIQKVDLIFVLGNTDFIQTSEIVRDLLIKDVSKTVLITGGKPEYEDSKNLSKTEAELILECIKPQDFPGVEFLLEKNSKNTLENVTKGIALFAQPIASLCFVNRSQGSQRIYLTLRKYLPNAKIQQQVFESIYDSIPVSRDNWFKSEFGQGRVWGEFLRIKKYGLEQQKIEFDEVADLVKKIEVCLKYT